MSIPVPTWWPYCARSRRSRPLAGGIRGPQAAGSTAKRRRRAVKAHALSSPVSVPIEHDDRERQGNPPRPGPNQEDKGFSQLKKAGSPALSYFLPSSSPPKKKKKCRAKAGFLSRPLRVISLRLTRIFREIWTVFSAPRPVRRLSETDQRRSRFHCAPRAMREDARFGTSLVAIERCRRSRQSSCPCPDHPFDPGARRGPHGMNICSGLVRA